MTEKTLRSFPFQFAADVWYWIIGANCFGLELRVPSEALYNPEGPLPGDYTESFLEVGKNTYILFWCNGTDCGLWPSEAAKLTFFDLPEQARTYYRPEWPRYEEATHYRIEDNDPGDVHVSFSWWQDLAVSPDGERVIKLNQGNHMNYSEWDTCSCDATPDELDSSAQTRKPWDKEIWRIARHLHEHQPVS